MRGRFADTFLVVKPPQRGGGWRHDGCVRSSSPSQLDEVCHRKSLRPRRLCDDEWLLGGKTGVTLRMPDYGFALPHAASTLLTANIMHVQRSHSEHRRIPNIKKTHNKIHLTTKKSFNDVKNQRIDRKSYRTMRFLVLNYRLQAQEDWLALPCFSAKERSGKVVKLREDSQRGIDGVRYVLPAGRVASQEEGAAGSMTGGMVGSALDQPLAT